MFGPFPRNRMVPCACYPNAKEGVFSIVILTQRIHTESLGVNVKSSVVVLDSAHAGPGGAGCLNS